MRVRIEDYTPKTNKGVQANCKAKGENMAQKAHSLSHTKWMCSITLCSPLSIDEKSFIINIEVVWEKYSTDYVVIKVLRLSKDT